ncbi:MAG: hypothetical protein IKB94_00355 [Clostridia bacterium]|nr:hypothetical protein [Clostridia bacterium]
MAIKTGTITARPTKLGANNAQYSGTIDNFIEGTGNFVVDVSTYTVFFYGFDFRELANKKNVNLTGLTLSMSCTGKNTSSTIYYDVNLVSDFNTSGTNVKTFTDLGDGTISYHSKPANTNLMTIQYTEANFPKAFALLKSNIQALIDGYETNTFGVKAYLRAMNMSSLTLTITYEYEETAYFVVSTAVKPEGSGSVSGGGTYEEGKTVTLTAIPNDGYVFKQWSDGNTDNPRTVTVTGDVTYTAEFESAMPEFTLVQMLYNNKQISKDNKVPAGQSFRLIAGVK